MVVRLKINTLGTYRVLPECPYTVRVEHTGSSVTNTNSTSWIL